MSRTDSARPSLVRRLLGAAAALLVAIGLVGVVSAPAQAAGTGVVSGTVSGTGGAALSNVLVQLFACGAPNPSSPDGCWTITGTQAFTAANGTYSFTGLEPGTYGLGFSPQSNNAQYAYEYYNNKTVFGAQDGFSVSNGATTTINASLQLGATISGTVLGDDGQPGEDIMVWAVNTATPNGASSAQVQPDGSYQFIGLQPGEFYLYAGPDYDSPSNLVREYYDNKPDAASANRFTVASGATATANFVLATGGTLSGNVKNGSSANLAGIDVEVYHEDVNGYWSRVAQTTTNASGNYLVEGIELGEYVVRFSDFGGTYAQKFLGGSADRAAASRVTLGPGSSLSGQNIVLSAGGTLAGTLTQKPTGSAAVASASAYYEAFRIDSEGAAESLSFSLQANASGQFSLSGLAPGQYLVRSFGSGSGGGAGGWAGEYAGGYYEDEATRFTVTAGNTTSGANVEVVPGVRISGQYTDTSLAPVSGVRVSFLHERTPGNWVTPPLYGGAGDEISYTVSSLPPGNYIVYWEDVSGSGTPYVTQYWNNKPTQGTATVISAPDGGSFTDITARLTKTPHPALTASAAANPSSPNGSNGWYKSGNVTVTLTAGGGHSAVPNTLQYKVNGAASWTSGSTVTVSTNGTTTITYRAVEEGLQTSPEGTLVIKRDTAVPTVSSSLSGRTVTITSADTGSSGVASTQYRIVPSTTWVAYTAPVTVGNAATTVEFRATDAAGNVSAVGSRSVPAAVGTVTVSTSASPASPNGANSWYTTNPTVTGSGTASLGGTVTIESKVGAGSYTEVASRTVSTDGTTVLTFRGTDQYGNVSSEVTRTIKLDKAAPTVSSSLSGRSVTVTASDATSGVASIQYRIAPSTTWLAYSTPVAVGSGAATIEFRATDNAGLVSTVGSRSVAADTDLPVPDRAEGSDRFETSTIVSESSYPDGADVVYVTTGMVFPDALSAGPAAAFDGGPLLLVPPTSLPTSVADEIERLNPSRIVVIGGEPSVSTAVFTQLKALVPNTTRIAGADRFETSRKVAAAVFGDSGANIAYIATGLNFPDALAAGGAAGKFDAPVILVNGGATSLDSATRELLDDLGVTEVKVLGGLPSVSAGVYSGLQSYLGASNVERFAGENRFHTAMLVNQDAFGPEPTVFLATGLNFPDALAGSAWAAKEAAPLYVVQQNCIPSVAPSNVLAAIQGHAPDEIVLLGGTPSLGTGVASLTPCG
ncbi:cell wall-binding repeat-containing protein [Schumannella luteola]